MIAVTFFLWFDPQGKYNARHLYRAENVNQVKRDVHANLTLPHEFVVVTQPERFTGFDPDIRVVPIDETLIRDGKRWPKLMIYRPDAAGLIGKRILAMDIDADVHGSLDDIAGRPEAFVGWKNPNPRGTIMNSSITLLAAGARCEVWDTFDLDEASAFAKADGRGGSDQAHVSRVLGDREAVWTGADGIYWSRDVAGNLPANARLVFHAGWDKPGRFAA